MTKAGTSPGLDSRTRVKKATISGWIGSALEYYDFFIYATAATLIFPQLFFPSTDPTVAIIASLATYGVGYVARPLGAFVLGHFGDTLGRKKILIFSMFLMGFATVGVGLLPTYEQIGLLAPALLVILRLIQGFAVAGEFSGSTCMILEHAPFGRRGFFASFTLQGVQAGQVLAAAVFLPLVHFMPEQAFTGWGWRIPFLLSVFVIYAAYVIRREVDETPAFAANDRKGEVSRSPVVEVLRLNWTDMVRVALMALMNVIPIVTSVFGASYAVQPAYGIGMSKEVYLWIPVAGNILAVLVIPFVGDLSDRIGRRPCIILGALGSGLLAYPYLLAVSAANVPLAFFLALLMWGFVYQGYNAVYPSFYPELFSTRVRVSGLAISQNLGTTATALMPAIFAAIAPPGSANIPWTIGMFALAVTAISALAALTTRETYRVRLEDLGNPGAAPADHPEYHAARQHARVTKA
ncbi:MFS transporter [Rhizobium paknamense]|uniref:MFS family permease n=1 Tax=Rhizobium paknamense TaxID=1206817 RepID=A0ABU0IJ35_9HYPH|nr:MFS transporter [Rhizobium paknamense]MDQ0458186.1 MFS family permease [Rhizobium paknamense]